MTQPHSDTVEARGDEAVRRSGKEISLITAAAELASIGQTAVRLALREGGTERELWLAAKSAMEDARQGDVPTEVDLMCGGRTVEIGLPPADYRPAPGDPVLVDLAPMREGYWADSCSTLSFGKPRPSLARRHSEVLAALERGISEARPGTTAQQVDRAIRDALDRHGLHCPHHTGHGVGTRAQEPPWLTPDDETVLEEGMVVALEPGAYGDGIGVRLEHLTVIESDGARPLTTHLLNLT
jgi:Xaa-Pro dipeptidase